MYSYGMPREVDCCKAHSWAEHSPAQTERSIKLEVLVNSPIRQISQAGGETLLIATGFAGAELILLSIGA